MSFGNHVGSHLRGFPVKPLSLPITRENDRDAGARLGRVCATSYLNFPLVLLDDGGTQPEPHA